MGIQAKGKLAFPQLSCGWHFGKPAGGHTHLDTGRPGRGLQPRSHRHCPQHRPQHRAPTHCPSGQGSDTVSIRCLNRSNFHGECHIRMSGGTHESLRKLQKPSTSKHGCGLPIALHRLGFVTRTSNCSGGSGCRYPPLPGQVPAMGSAAPPTPLPGPPGSCSSTRRSPGGGPSDGGYLLLGPSCLSGFSLLC